MPQDDKSADNSPGKSADSGSSTAAATDRITALTQMLMPSVPRPAAWLGVAGLLPFAALALAAVILGGAVGDLAAAALAGYGAAILSFMGGCRWGFVAAGIGAEESGGSESPMAWWRYGVSVVPALYATAVLLIPDPWRPALLAGGFIGLLVADLGLAVQKGAPDWWPALRWPLSLGAAGCLAIAALLG